MDKADKHKRVLADVGIHFKLKWMI